MGLSLPSQRRIPAGFTLLEIVVIVAIVVVLAGFLVPAGGRMIRDARANKIAALADLLRDACQRFTVDTGYNAVEIGGSESSPEIRDDWHQLWAGKKAGSKIPGWNGPYIDHPISYRENPSGGFIAVHDFLSDSTKTFPGFILTAGGQPKVRDGNALELGSIDAELAEAVNNLLDLDDRFGSWETAGRVCYLANNKTLLIFLLETPL